MRIDPWASEQYTDYARLRDEFGIEEFKADGLPNPQKLFRRGIVFGSRGFETIQNAIDRKQDFIILTGLMPSGNMHIGHKMLIDQVIYYQSIGAEIYIAVADIESWGARNLPLEEAREVAIQQYVVSYIAMGLKPENCQIYFQSKRKSVLDLSYKLGRKINLSEMRAIYGFDEGTNMAHAFAPLVQVGDITHPQLDEYSGPHPLLVPVGVDQDPHMRLTRGLTAAHRYFNVTKTKDERIGVFVKLDDNVDKLLDDAESKLTTMGFSDFEKIYAYKALYVNDAGEVDIPFMDNTLLEVEREHGGYGFYLPASTYHRFMTGLTGGKMSSSDPDSSIFLTDEPEVGKQKSMNAKTGGRVSQEEQRKFGGRPDECVVFELYLYHLTEDDNELTEIYETCKGGSRMCGPCKRNAADLMANFLKELQEKRENAKEMVDEYIVNN
ncbi:MAG: tryptophan--tRNA ligase [Thermoplasmata archaeon]|nr:MAG: tryptophan--tRNA ligase [Thermoplasmata archaeon]